MKKMLLFVIVVMLMAGTVWAGQPTVKSTKIEPEQAKVGDAITFTVEFTGKADDIQMVEIIVRENPYDAPEMFLEPVKESKDNVWTLSANVPYEAPVQSFHLEVKVLDKEGKEIVTEEYKDQEWGKAGLIRFSVVE